MYTKIYIYLYIDIYIYFKSSREDSVRLWKQIPQETAELNSVFQTSQVVKLFEKIILIYCRANLINESIWATDLLSTNINCGVWIRMEQEQTPPQNIYGSVGWTLGCNMQLGCSVSCPALHILSCPGHTSSPAWCVWALPSIAFISEGRARVFCINNLVVTLLVLWDLKVKSDDQ